MIRWRTRIAAAALGVTSPAFAQEPAAAPSSSVPMVDATPNAAAATPAPATPEPVGEVRVTGAKLGEPSAPHEEIRGRDIRLMPGAFGDAFRALEALPGVTPMASGLPYFFVRGAPPGNTGFFIDGVRVPGLFHLGIGPAVIYPALIDRVDLFKGAYPVNFGRLSGGILSADTVRPADHARADWTLRLFDAGALVEAPIGTRDDGSPRATALASGRYGYPGLLLKLFAPDAGLAYWDYQTRVTCNVTDRDTLSAFAFGSYDSISTREEDALGRKSSDLREVLNIQFHRLDLRWDHRLSKTGAIRAAVTLGYDRTGTDGYAVRSYVAGARVLANERFGKVLTMRAGADTWFQSYGFPSSGADAPSQGNVLTQSGSGEQKDINFAAWVDAPLELAKHVTVTPGVRVDTFTSRGIGPARAIPSVDPRLTSRVAVGPFYHLGAIGVAHQPSSVPLPLPALSFTQLQGGLQAGYQLSQGLETPLPAGFTLTTTGYLNTYTGLVELAVRCKENDPSCEQTRVRGQSVGLEVLLKRELSRRVGGWIAYTLSRTTRDAFDPVRQRHTSVLSEFDRPHVLNVVLTVDVGAGVRVAGHYIGYSGLPYSSIGEFNLPNARTPGFHRLDVRAEKRWVLGGGQSLAVTAEMFNVLLMKEAISTCEFPPNCKPQEIGPIAIPSLGFEGTL